MANEAKFHPHPLLIGGHLQTLGGFYWPDRQPTYRATAIEVSVTGGDRIVLHDDRPKDWKPTSRVVLLIHGLAGCHGSPYMARIAAKLNQLGIRTFRMDMRGCGASAGKAKLPGHAGRCEDAIAAANTIAQSCPSAPLSVVGFSMGGNIALRTLAAAEKQSVGNLTDGIAIAPPVDLSRCCRELQEGLSKWYDRYLVRRMVRSWRENGGQVPDPEPRSIYEFDDRITAPLSGYTDAEDYYAHASSGPLLDSVQLPTKILAAEDDPMVAYAAIAAAPRSTAVTLHGTVSGGHLGYMSRRRDAPSGRWMDSRVVEWVTTERASRASD